jgi:hypothetical protein
MATYPQTYSFRDAKGQTSTMRMWIVNATDAGAKTAGVAVRTALDALTNAAPGPASGADSTAPAPNAYGTSAQYANIEDKALLTFQTATGAIHRYQLPAPIVGAFEADQETVKVPNGAGDAQQILLQNLVTAMVGNVSSRDASLLASFIGGIYIRRRFKRKFNIFTKDPDLDGPGE